MQHKCEKRVFSNFSFYACGKIAKVESNGIWLCGIHSPEAEAKRKAKSDAKSAEWSRKWKEKERKDVALKLLLGAAEKWMDAQTSQNITDLYNACIVHFERKAVIPD